MKKIETNSYLIGIYGISNMVIEVVMGRIMVRGLTLFACSQLVMSASLMAEPSVKGSLPKKIEVNLPMVLGLAYQGSDSAKLIKLEMVDAEASRLRAAGVLDESINLSTSRSISSADTSGGAFSPEEVDVAEQAIGLSKTFSTGTNLTVQYKRKNQKTLYPTAEASSEAVSSFRPSTDYWESTLGVTMRQSLLKNAFGIGTRSKLRGGELESQAREKRVQVNLEQWATEFIGLYYQTWLAKESWKVAQERLMRQRRLLKATKIKSNRGTAEKSELLQIESAVLNSENQVADSKLVLEQIWRQLIVLLDLPDSWLSYPLEKVQIDLDENFEKGLKVCREREIKFDEDAQLSLQRKIYESAAEEEVHTQNQLYPDVYVDLSASINGIDDDRSVATEDFIAGDYPSYAISIGVNWTIDNQIAKANFLASRKKKLAAETSLHQKKDQFRLDWENHCHEFLTLRNKMETYKKSLSKQLERVKIESRRFEIGQIDLFNVIQAENDALSAEISYKSTQVKLREVGWRMQRMSGGLKTFMKSLAEVNIEGSR